MARLKFRVSVKNIASRFHPNHCQSTESQPNQSRSPSAGWLEFFKEVGLDELGTDVWGTNTRKVVADYLPDDILAAPAYAQVGAIVAAAAIAGIQKVDIDKQTAKSYPILFGQGFQIDFRQHPTLGIVGAYSRYNETSKESEGLNIEELRSTIKYGRGFVDDRENMNVSTHSTRRNLIANWSRLGEAHAITCRSWSATFALNSSAISEAYLPLIVGMFAERPIYVPALFPTTTMRNNNCLTTLVLSSKYWAKMHFKEPKIWGWYQLEEPPTWNGFIWPRLTDWESTLSPEAGDLYCKLFTGGNYPVSSWGPDMEKGHMANLAAATARLAAQLEENVTATRTQLLEGAAPADASATGLHTEKEERATSSRTQLDKELAPTEITETRQETEEKAQTAEAEAIQAAATQSVISEAGLPIEKTVTNSEASVGEPTVSQHETKAEAKGIDGDRLVLHTCVELLHEPAILEQWLFEASFDSRKFLASLVREQIRDVDQWLHDKLRDEESIRHRSILLCNTTIVLLRVEQMIDDNFFKFSGPEEPQGHGVQGGSFEQQQTQSSDRGRHGQGSNSGTHFRILQVLRTMVDGLHEKVRGASELENLLHDRSDSSLLWDRLKTIVVYHSKDEQLWHDFKGDKYDKAARDIDDVIIYRCLMMVLLFRTAADSSKILESGIWDQVVPII